MTNYYDLISPRKRRDRDGNEKTSWHRVGAAFPAREGDAFSLVFDSLPLPDAEGRVSVRMSRPLPKDGDNRGGYERQAPRDAARQAPPQGSGSARYEDLDEVPF